MRAIALCAAMVFAMGLPALSDGVITLQLETPTLRSSAPESGRAQRTVTTVTGKASPGQRIARVAVVVAGRANIYSRATTKSRLYATCLKDVPLAIVSTSGSWYGVLMIDGTTGWVQSNKVKLLDYTVAAAVPRTGSYPARGGLERGAGTANAIVQTALRYIGVPYVYGGTSTVNGMDCSAFVRSVFAAHGIRLPRVAREQADVGTPVTWDELQPGDRLYFACKHSYVDHCGIYIGNGYFIHASASRGGVTIDSLSSDFYSRTLAAAMR